mmetsp:Transcript_26557/g.87225  ORF Transcript_26557/g.87225 Transcript_26557/m.87225 type:complete len:357 (+) Transcript_26557:1828-2898(+)
MNMLQHCSASKSLSSSHRCVEHHGLLTADLDTLQSSERNLSRLVGGLVIVQNDSYEGKHLRADRVNDSFDVTLHVECVDEDHEERGLSDITPSHSVQVTQVVPQQALSPPHLGGRRSFQVPSEPEEGLVERHPLLGNHLVLQEPRLRELVHLQRPEVVRVANFRENHVGKDHRSPPARTHHDPVPQGVSGDEVPRVLEGPAGPLVEKLDHGALEHDGVSAVGVESLVIERRVAHPHLASKISVPGSCLGEIKSEALPSLLDSMLLSLRPEQLVGTQVVHGSKLKSMRERSIVMQVVSSVMDEIDVILQEKHLVDVLPQQLLEQLEVSHEEAKSSLGGKVWARNAEFKNPPELLEER